MVDDGEAGDASAGSSDGSRAIPSRSVPPTTGRLGVLGPTAGPTRRWCRRRSSAAGSSAAVVVGARRASSSPARRAQAPRRRSARYSSRLKVTVVKAKIRADTTVMRSRLRSATVDPAAVAPEPATEHVGQAAALPGVQQHEEDEEQAVERRGRGRPRT